MKAWQRENEIPFCSTMLKVRDLGKANKRKEKQYVINQILAQHGHTKTSLVPSQPQSHWAYWGSCQRVDH
jgi:hypothetical protein